MFTIDPLGLGPVRKVTLWFKFTSVIFKVKSVHRSCLTADEMEVIIVVVFVAAAAISMRPLLFKKWMNWPWIIFLVWIKLWWCFLYQGSGCNPAVWRTHPYQVVMGLNPISFYLLSNVLSNIYFTCYLYFERLFAVQARTLSQTGFAKPVLFTR